MVRHGEDGSGWSYFPVHSLPTGLDIVWCRFPELPDTRPGPKQRPGLVRCVSLSRDHKFGRVQVSYGTSKLKKDLYPFDLFIENAAQLTLLGLAQATRFELERCVWLPWCAEFFTPRDGTKTPVIGALTDKEKAQLQTIARIRDAQKKSRS